MVLCQYVCWCWWALYHNSPRPHMSSRVQRTYTTHMANGPYPRETQKCSMYAYIHTRDRSNSCVLSWDWERIYIQKYKSVVSWRRGLQRRQIRFQPPLPSHSANNKCPRSLVANSDSTYTHMYYHSFCPNSSVLCLVFSSSPLLLVMTDRWPPAAAHIIPFHSLSLSLSLYKMATPWSLA